MSTRFNINQGEILTNLQICARFIIEICAFKDNAQDSFQQIYMQNLTNDPKIFQS